MANVTVYHPLHPNVSESVPKDSVDQWAEAGWRKTPLKSDDSPSPADGNSAAK